MIQEEIYLNALNAQTQIQMIVSYTIIGIYVLGLISICIYVISNRGE